ncbi:hypothetical protein JQ633_31990 [Bradyrhizobium tropiciagri]|uniref:hypothetical protein n=1 Tax=Bradyrhizobium tropiciagri TaxID=312253 RepID=UPI001BA7EF78|nr:hypothetical protein [Bradyrhizobium tropiciagri]MBR0875018.1 hypothetical protein [Bradyrhizobium tropiciagri]
MRPNKSMHETFGSDANCLAMLIHLASLTKGMNDGPYKMGFEQAIEEAGAYLDHLNGDGNDVAQTLMEQMCGLINGCYALTEVNGTLESVLHDPPKGAA